MQKLLNIAVIAHVDAGKSTLVDAMLEQSGVFGSHEVVQEQVMDSDAIERERGITIYSKNCSVNYDGIKINIVDTPGHADFSSEVERIIRTVDTVILLVDSSEGPMPQTRFVLKKSLEIGLKPILLINKIDKPDRRVNEVIDLVYELFMDLDATDDQLEFPILYGIAKKHIVQYNLDDEGKDIRPLFETIVKHTKVYPDKDDLPLQLQISSLAYDDYIGRLGIGRIYQGTVKKGQTVMVSDAEGKTRRAQIAGVFTYKGLNRTETESAGSGDIVLVSGISDISIGETINQLDNILPLPAIKVEEPTLSMNFLVNTSPFAGQDGKYVTSRNIKERLEKELEVNVGLRVEPTASPDTFVVSGRGELHLSILVENMRREGYELAISKPQVITQVIDGHTCEPIEEVIIEVPDEYSGSIISQMSLRQGEMVDMGEDRGMIKQVWYVPTRGLIGFRSDFINMTRGEGTMVRQFHGYSPMKGEIAQRQNGSMVSTEAGVSMTYSIFNLQERGQFFIGPQTDVYEGMIVGISARSMDMEVNPTKNKKATSIRSAGKDEAMRLVPPIPLTLEYALEFIRDDELVEVTPHNIRLRKRYLKSHERKNANREKNMVQ
ncbi:GTP-binding protein TypA [Erysipelothrix larvae]|uniref:Large ribosomal subunit assembly factor BipA n=1 Tax=Erysipelothrix larvae TaxID=1514105 RepID=A0A0X8H207_9FIRM|nr:translational GTPase TypA [Erysipelothrix larvae]AMC94613.1 GTP-binding protein TypA [Erysipelothrix larvae]